MRGTRAVLLGLVVTACGGGAPAAVMQPARTPAPLAHDQTRVTILPDVVTFEGRLVSPTYLGATAEGRELWAFEGLRVAHGPRGVEVAEHGLPRPIVAASLDSDGAWRFLLEDGQLWGAAEALAAPTHLGPVARPRHMHDILQHLVRAQRGRLAFTYRGRAFVIDAGPTARRLDALPASLVERVASQGDRLIARLTGGGVFEARGDDARWARLDEGDALPSGSDEQGHALPPDRTILEAIVRAHPPAAHALGRPLAGGGSLAHDGDALLRLRPEGRVEVRWPRGEIFALEAWEGRVVLLGDDTVSVSDDDGQLTPWEVEGPGFLRDALTGSRGPDTLVIGLDGRGRTVDLEGTVALSSRWVVRADGDELSVRRWGEDAEGEEVARLPAAGAHEVGLYGDVVLAGRALWSRAQGRLELPEGARHVAGFADGTLLCWGDALPSLRMRRPGGSWTPIAASAPALHLPSEASCAGDRCVLRRAGVAVLVERGDTLDRVHERVARMEDDAYVGRVARVPRISAHGTRVFGYVHLRCTTQPAAAPSPRGGSLRVEASGATLAWSAGARRATRSNEIHPGTLSAAVVERGHALFWLGGQVLEAQERGVPIPVVSDVTHFDAVSTGPGTWLALAARGDGGHYLRWTPAASGRPTPLAEPRADGRCYGLARRGGVWGALMCAPGERAAWLPFEDAGMPAPVDLVPLDAEAAPTVCDSEPRDLARVPIVMVGETAPRGGAVAVVGLDGTPCLWRLEQQRSVDFGAWTPPGALVSDRDGRLRGVLREGDAWVEQTCEPTARPDDG